ncbi:MAG TPA: tryptophan-rich sensory protein [Cyclobacteriaceae bacterium]|nr:tryptophan-rich sensory protein [Cyclobacteriaceae bacterium]
MIHRRLPADGWRMFALFTVLVNVVFNYISNYTLPLPSMEEVSHSFSSLFTPHDYAFSIWGLIYFSFIVYGIYQAMPSRSEDPLYRNIAKPFALVNILAMAWIVVFRMQLMWVSVAIILIMLCLSIFMLILSRDAVLRDEYSNWVSVPFSLLAGWLSVATIANISTLFVYMGWQGTVMNQVIITIVMIFIATLIGIYVCARCKDFIFPMVIAWACVAIFVSRSNDFPYLAAVALATAIMPPLWMATTMIRRISYRRHILANKFSF